MLIMIHPEQSLPEVVCQQLRGLILADRWRKTLPGIRVLCEEMQVSRQTMMLALRLLEDEGVVKPASPGKSRAINPEMANPVGSIAKKGNPPVVVVIAWHMENLLSQTDAEICSHLRKSFTSQSFDYRHIVFQDITRARGAKSINHVIEQDPADIYIVLGAHQQCSRALKKLGVPVVYIGGNKVPGCTPRIFNSMSGMSQVAMDHLISIGHRKISVMLPQVVNLASKNASPAEAAMERAFQAHKLPFSTYNCPRWGKTKDEFIATLEDLFSLTPPTALILCDAAHVPRVISFLMRRGLKYPDDVSLISLDGAHELQEYDPPISYMKKPNAALAKVALTAAQKVMASQQDTDQNLIVDPTALVVTGSIAEVVRE